LSLLAYPPLNDGTDVQTFDDFIEAFDWSKINTTGPVFDLAKLDFLNGAYIRELSDDELADHLEAFWRSSGVLADVDEARVLSVGRAAAPLIKPRLTTLAEAWGMIDFLLVADHELVVDQAAIDALPEEAALVLDVAIEAIEGSAGSAYSIEESLRVGLLENLGLKPRVAFNPVRTAIAGRLVSPPLFESMAILGRESCLVRLKRLRAML